MDAAVGEEKLVEQARRGDVGAFNALVARYQRLAYSVAYRLLGDGEAAADATQDAFTSAYQAIGRFRGGSFRAWLLRIVSNACYDVLRSRQRHPTASLDALLDDEDNPASFPDPGETPEEAALRRELARQIQRGLLALPLEQRTAVVLYDIQGLSYEEIAEVTHAALGTVKSRLSRGRAGLRDFLRAQAEHLPGGGRHNHENHDAGGPRG